MLQRASTPQTNDSLQYSQKNRNETHTQNRNEIITLLEKDKKYNRRRKKDENNHLFA